MKLDNRIWILLTAVASVGILAAAWFLGVSPQLQAMGTSALQLASVDATNASTKAQITKLQSESSNLSDLKNELGTLQKSVPPGVEGSEFIAHLNGMVSATGVQLTKLTLGSPVDYASPVATDSSATTGETAAGGATASPTASPTPTPTPAATTAPTASGAADGTTPLTDPLITSENFVMVPVDLEVSGTNAQVLSFLQRLQNGDRLVLVTALSKVQQEGSNGAAVDNYQLTVTGYIYVLKNSEAEASAAANG